MRGTLGSVDDDAQRRIDLIWNVTRQALVAVTVVGVLLAFVNADAGAVVIAASLGLLVAAQVTIAVVHYRRTMRRPWPAVEPLTDDDDDW
jgi:O-antigen/teichoic acid export membrane protein